MNAFTDSELIAPCGMNCAICSSYLAFKNDIKRKDIKIRYCLGCRPRNKKCAFLNKYCTKLSKGEITFCFDCTSFPCDRLITLDKRYKSLFRMSMIENLNFIKDNGIERFLNKQKELWKCEVCGAQICCHNGICYNCSIEKLKNKKQMYRWEE